MGNNDRIDTASLMLPLLNTCSVLKRSERKES